jgi:biopolymer transport protein ExbD
MSRGTSARRRAWLARAVLAAVVAAVFAWASRRGSDEAVDDVGLPPPPEALARTTRDLDLPRSASTTVDHAPDAVSVVVTRTAILVGGDPIPIARFPEGLAPGTAELPERAAQASAGGDLVNELEYFLAQSKARGEAPAAAVLADGSTPFGVLSEVLSTVRRTGFARMDIGVRGRDARLAWIAMRLPPAVQVWEIWPGPAPALSIDEEGFALRWGREPPAPGCDPRTGGTQVPAIAGRYDARGLETCVARIKREAPWMDGETRLLVRPSPRVAWQDVVSVLDAVAPSFPDLRFASAADGAHEDWERFVMEERADTPALPGPRRRGDLRP